MTEGVGHWRSKGEANDERVKGVEQCFRGDFCTSFLLPAE